MNEIRILGLLITDRIKEAGRTQKVLSEHSSVIQSRLGFHELSEDKNSRTGIILLHLTGNQEEWERLESDLAAVGGVELQKMSFIH